MILFIFPALFYHTHGSGSYADCRSQTVGNVMSNASHASLQTVPGEAVSAVRGRNGTLLKPVLCSFSPNNHYKRIPHLGLQE